MGIFVKPCQLHFTFQINNVLSFLKITHTKFILKIKVNKYYSMSALVNARLNILEFS